MLLSSELQLWCWGRLLRIPRADKKKQTKWIIKQIKPEFSLKAQKLKLS